MRRAAIASRTRYDVLSCYGFSCFYCGARAPKVVLQVDHVVPVSKGGTNKPWNLVPACRECNGGKSDSVPDDETVERARHYWSLFLEQQRRGRAWSKCTYCSTPVPTELEEEVTEYECGTCNGLACWAYENGQRATLRNLGLSDRPDQAWRLGDWADIR